jgi:hypothetical protein
MSTPLPFGLMLLKDTPRDTSEVSILLPEQSRPPRSGPFLSQGPIISLRPGNAAPDLASSIDTDVYEPQSNRPEKGLTPPSFSVTLSSNRW